jgi:drug/metabolite transporter (DMT)-like permease
MDEEQPLMGTKPKPYSTSSTGLPYSYATESHEESTQDCGETLPLPLSQPANKDHQDEKQAGVATVTVTVTVTREHLLLLLVAILYGTLNVSLRAVYDLPDPPSASALSTVRGWLAVLCFAPLLWHQNKQQQSQPPLAVPAAPLDSTHTDGRSNMATDVTTQQSQQQQQQQQQQPDLWKVAAELAVWNFGAQALVNVGLMYVLAARAAFFTQLSVVMTPVLSAMAGHNVHANVWWACGIAFGGLILLSEKVSNDNDSDNDSDNGNTFDMTLSLGDILCLCGALSWSTYLFRVSAVGNAYDEVILQAVKNVVLASLYTIWFLLELLITGERQWVGCTSSLVAWVVLFYSALGPGTIADVVQQKAQATVVATVANIILSSEPVFTAILGRVFLGELTTWSEKIGGCFILVAAVVATRE